MSGAHDQPLDRHPAHWPQFRAACARIGRDPRLVQGAGGNVSLKQDGLLRIKASGRWLAEADQHDIFVPLQLDCARQRVASGSEDYASCLLEGSTLRPSIESGMHAALPHRVVVHVHSLAVLACATLAQGEDLLVQGLKGLHWHWIPYCRPGAPLTRAIVQRVDLDSNAPVALVLANHGLVVAAHDMAQTMALLEAVEQALARPPRPIDISRSGARLASIGRAIGARLPDDPALHGLALDETSLAIAALGPLYPDHVVFLGAVPVIRDADAMTDFRWSDDTSAPYVIVRHEGLLLRPDISDNALAMLGCWAALAQRLHGPQGVRPLSVDEMLELTGWDAEKYRQSLERTTRP